MDCSHTQAQEEARQAFQESLTEGQRSCLQHDCLQVHHAHVHRLVQFIEATLIF